MAGGRELFGASASGTVRGTRHAAVSSSGNLTDRCALIALFEAVAREEGWQPGDQLRAYQDHSVYFALHVEKTLAGGLQLVLPDAAGQLPCQRVWPELDLCEESGVAHVAVLALRREFRGKGQGDLFWRLVIALWRHCVLVGIYTLYLEVTPRVLPLYQRLGWPLQVCGPERLHWGEPCLICSLDVRQVAGALAERAICSATYRDILARAVAPRAAGQPAKTTAGSRNPRTRSKVAALSKNETAE